MLKNKEKRFGEILKELKIIALKQDKAVKDILNELIQDFVNENK